MKRKNKVTNVERKLIRRYLIWCYKTTREELERIDRKFTQLTVDYFIRDELSRLKQREQDLLKIQLEGFKDYIVKKETSAYLEKFANSNKVELRPEYLYLKVRLAVIEKAIGHFLGKQESAVISQLYEEEMTKRILEAKDHK